MGWGASFPWVSSFCGIIFFQTFFRSWKVWKLLINCWKQKALPNTPSPFYPICPRPSPHVCLRSRRPNSAFPPSAPSQVLMATSFQIQLFSPHHMFYSFVKFIYSGNFQIYTLRKCQNSVNNSHGSIIQLQWLSTSGQSFYSYSHSLIPSCVQFSSVPQSCPTLWDPMDCSTPGLPVHHQLLELAQTHVHWVSDIIQPSHPLSSPSPPSFNLPSIRVFSNESPLRISWPKYWSFSFSINPSKQYSELISFSMDWLDLLTVQGTFKSPLQHHSSKASILQRSAFFIVQLSHPYMTTGKNHSLD